MAAESAVHDYRPARYAVSVAVLVVVLVAVVLGALTVGRFGVSFIDVCRILLGRLVPVHQTWSDSEQRVVLDVRLPRVLLAMLIGAGLAVSGAVLQAVFRNPLVNPQILGVSSGASFGGALAILLGLGAALQVCGAFVLGLIALAVVFLVSRTRTGEAPVLTLVLAGVVTGSFFSALVSLVTYVADPYTQLPAIIFWLLGSLATATYAKLSLAAAPILIGTAVGLLLRWRINVLSLGDEDATALGIRPGPLRWLLLCAVSAVVAGAVAVSGVIGWVGLVVPHLARMLVGPDHRVLLPVAMLMGASYLTLIDTIARTATPGEIPLGVLTALIGAPVFFALLRRSQTRMWTDA